MTLKVIEDPSDKQLGVFLDKVKEMSQVEMQELYLSDRRYIPIYVDESGFYRLISDNRLIPN